MLLAETFLNRLFFPTLYYPGFKKQSPKNNEAVFLNSGETFLAAVHTSLFQPYKNLYHLSNKRALRVVCGTDIFRQTV
jgi:hypothetical protein